jgi:hypothetical protein
VQSQWPVERHPSGRHPDAAGAVLNVYGADGRLVRGLPGVASGMRVGTFGGDRGVAGQSVTVR